LNNCPYPEWRSRRQTLCMRCTEEDLDSKQRWVHWRICTCSEYNWIGWDEWSECSARNFGILACWSAGSKLLFGILERGSELLWANIFESLGMCASAGQILDRRTLQGTRNCRDWNGNALNCAWCKRLLFQL
jgi:hypothetical protein